MIEASTVKVSTMSDDTLRLVIDIDPRFAQEAFALFGQRGSPVVIARLTQEAAAAARQAATIAGDTGAPESAEKPVGGPLARLAGMLCNDPQFREWADVGDAQAAAEYVRRTCGVQSRVDLDHDENAERWFHARIRLPYLEWRKARVAA